MHHWQMIKAYQLLTKIQQHFKGNNLQNENVVSFNLTPFVAVVCDT